MAIAKPPVNDGNTAIQNLSNLKKIKLLAVAAAFGL